jgi:hypothetical protein
MGYHNVSLQIQSHIEYEPQHVLHLPQTITKPPSSRLTLSNYKQFRYTGKISAVKDHEHAEFSFCPNTGLISTEHCRMGDIISCYTATMPSAPSQAFL